MSTDEPMSHAQLLRAAAYHGDLHLVVKLIAEGVDVNIWDKWGRTALSLAAGQGHQAIAELLLTNGAWVNPHEDYDVYQTPLYAAAIGGHLEVVKLLIANGANPHFHVGMSQRTPAAYAFQDRHPEVGKYLEDVMNAMRGEQGLLVIRSSPRNETTPRCV